MWCNGNTADSGSAFGGSSPSIPGVKWSLRLTVRTGDSQSLNSGSIPLGTIKSGQRWPLFFYQSALQLSLSTMENGRNTFRLIVCPPSILSTRTFADIDPSSCIGVWIVVSLGVV